MPRMTHKKLDNIIKLKCFSYHIPPISLQAINQKLNKGIDKTIPGQIAGKPLSKYVDDLRHEQTYPSDVNH